MVFYFMELKADHFQYWVWEYERCDGWNCIFRGAYFLRLARKIFVGNQKIGREGLNIFSFNELTSSPGICIYSTL